LGVRAYCLPIEHVNFSGSTGLLLKLDLEEVALEDLDRIDLGQDRDMWPAVMKVVMNLKFRKMRENFSPYLGINL
jgi:hypothetical protein